MSKSSDRSIGGLGTIKSQVGESRTGMSGSEESGVGEACAESVTEVGTDEGKTLATSSPLIRSGFGTAAYTGERGAR